MRTLVAFGCLVPCTPGACRTAAWRKGPAPCRAKRPGCRRRSPARLRLAKAVCWPSRCSAHPLLCQRAAQAGRTAMPRSRLAIASACCPICIWAHPWAVPQFGVVGLALQGLLATGEAAGPQAESFQRRSTCRRDRDLQGLVVAGEAFLMAPQAAERETLVVPCGHVASASPMPCCNRQDSSWAENDGRASTPWHTTTRRDPVATPVHRKVASAASSSPTRPRPIPCTRATRRKSERRPSLHRIRRRLWPIGPAGPRPGLDRGRRPDDCRASRNSFRRFRADSSTQSQIVAAGSQQLVLEDGVGLSGLRGRLRRLPQPQQAFGASQWRRPSRRRDPVGPRCSPGSRTADGAVVNAALSSNRSFAGVGLSLTRVLGSTIASP